VPVRSKLRQDPIEPCVVDEEGGVLRREREARVGEVHDHLVVEDDRPEEAG
jgi:hypothetical protein